MIGESVLMNDGERIDMSATSSAGGTRLSGRWLLAARVAWLFLFAVALVPFLLSLPGYRASIEHPSPDNAALSPGAMAALTQAGISLSAYAWVSLGIACAVLLASVIIALVLVWRRGNDWMALLVSIFLVIYILGNVSIPSNGPSADPSSASEIALAVLAGQQNLLGTAIPFGVFLLFPSGRFVPRWAAALFIASLVWAVAISVWPGLLGGVLFLGYPAIIGATIVCMIYRYRRASTPVQRQQTKWVVAGLVISLLANQVFWIPTGFTALGQTLYPPLCYLAYQLVLLVVPVTFFIAIQRYRLYDIDTIINRALVYGALTAILALVYAGGVVGLQALVGTLTGSAGRDGSPVVIVVTTLAIAALVRPLRARLQATVDRRFYRSKYDAAKTVAAFGATPQQEMELGALREHLLAVVDETMQPAHASLWLLTPAPDLRFEAHEGKAARYPSAPA
jgi:hypothetical protein